MSDNLRQCGKRSQQHKQNASELKAHFMNIFGSVSFKCKVANSVVKLSESQYMQMQTTNCLTKLTN